MPVTAKLSLRFYEKLGEDVANELVEWFNSVDATYRGDLRELNELNFARFDAKVEQRIGILEAKVDHRIDALEAKVEQRIGALEAKMEARFAASEARVDARFESLEARLVQRIESRVGALRHEMARWMFASWSTLMLALLGTLFAVLKGH
jgi:chaperonin cofactor prefoldin